MYLSFFLTIISAELRELCQIYHQRLGTIRHIQKSYHKKMFILYFLKYTRNIQRLKNTMIFAEAHLGRHLVSTFSLLTVSPLRRKHTQGDTLCYHLKLSETDAPKNLIIIFSKKISIYSLFLYEVEICSGKLENIRSF